MVPSQHLCLASSQYWTTRHSPSPSSPATPNQTEQIKKNEPNSTKQDWIQTAPNPNLLLIGADEFIGGLRERSVKWFDLEAKVGNDVLLLGKFRAQNRGLWFEQGDARWEGDGSDFAGHIELFKRIRRQHFQDTIRKIEAGTAACFPLHLPP